MMNNPEIRKTGEGYGSGMRTKIYRLRALLLDKIYDLFPKPENSLMAGIILGDESRIPSSIERDFQKTGTAHIIAISGSNFTVLCWFILALVRNLIPYWWTPLTMIPFVIFYTILVGGNAAVVRAAVMCVFTMGGMCIGRSRNGINSLVMTAAIMVLWSPLMLFDIGFQLSATATLGILLFSDPLKELLEKLLLKIRFLKPEQRVSIVGIISDWLLISVSAQIFTLWISAGAFGQISLVSLPCNFLIAPFQSLIMLGGFLTLFLSFIFMPLAQIAAWIIRPAPALTIRIVQWMARPESAGFYADISQLNVWLIIGLILIVWLNRERLFKNFRKKLPVYAAALLAVCCLYAGTALAKKTDPRLLITFESYGSAYAMEIDTPGNRSMIISRGQTNYAARDLFDRNPLYDDPIDAAVIDLSEEWMEAEFLKSRAAADLPVLYLGGKAAKLPEERTDAALSQLTRGMSLTNDGVTLHVAAEYMGRRAWLIRYGNQGILFPLGISAERIFARGGISPEQVSLVLFGKDDQPEAWQSFFCPGRFCEHIPQSLDISGTSVFRLYSDGTDFECFRDG